MPSTIWCECLLSTALCFGSNRLTLNIFDLRLTKIYWKFWCLWFRFVSTWFIHRLRESRFYFRVRGLTSLGALISIDINANWMRWFCCCHKRRFVETDRLIFVCLHGRDVKNGIKRRFGWLAKRFKSTTFPNVWFHMLQMLVHFTHTKFWEFTNSVGLLNFTQDNYTQWMSVLINHDHKNVSWQNSLKMKLISSARFGYQNSNFFITRRIPFSPFVHLYLTLFLYPSTFFPCAYGCFFLLAHRWRCEAATRNHLIYFKIWLFFLIKCGKPF